MVLLAARGEFYRAVDAFTPSRATPRADAAWGAPGAVSTLAEPVARLLILTPYP